MHTTWSEESTSQLSRVTYLGYSRVVHSMHIVVIELCILLGVEGQLASYVELRI